MKTEEPKVKPIEPTTQETKVEEVKKEAVAEAPKEEIKKEAVAEAPKEEIKKEEQKQESPAEKK